MKPNPLLPVPNDDPACKCEIGSAPAGFVVVEGAISEYGRICVAYDPECPHHSVIVRIMESSTPLAFSVGVRAIPAEPA